MLPLPYPVVTFAEVQFYIPFLVDHTTAYSIVGSWLDTVDRLSVVLCIVVL